MVRDAMEDQALRVMDTKVGIIPSHCNCISFSGKFGYCIEFHPLPNSITQQIYHSNQRSAHSV
jgi:hypothetical protein